MLLAIAKRVLARLAHEWQFQATISEVVLLGCDKATGLTLNSASNIGDCTRGLLRGPSSHFAKAAFRKLLLPMNLAALGTHTISKGLLEMPETWLDSPLERLPPGCGWCQHSRPLFLWKAGGRIAIAPTMKTQPVNEDD